MSMWERYRLGFGTALLVLALVGLGWRYGEDRAADQRATAIDLCEQQNLALDQINSQADWVAGILESMSVLVDGDAAAQAAISAAIASRPPSPTTVPDCINPER